MSNGKRFSFNIGYTGVEQPDWGDALEIIKQQWKDIGVEMHSNSVERSIYYSRGEANDHDIMVWGVPGGLDPMLDPRDVLAMHPQASWYAIPWTKWYLSNGKEGEEPERVDEVERLKLYDEYKQTADPAKQAEICKQILQKAADAFEIVRHQPCAPNLLGVVNKDLRNVPARDPLVVDVPRPGARCCRRPAAGIS